MIATGASWGRGGGKRQSTRAVWLKALRPLFSHPDSIQVAVALYQPSRSACVVGRRNPAYGRMHTAICLLYHVHNWMFVALRRRLFVLSRSLCSHRNKGKLESSAPISTVGDAHGVDLAHISELKQSHPENLMAKHFDTSYFSTLCAGDKQALLQCCRSGIANPDSKMGVYAMQPSDYDRFKPFFSKVLADNHHVSEDAKHVNSWDLQAVEGLPADGLLDLKKLGVSELSMRVRVGRNLADFPLPGAMTKEDRVQLEKKMCVAFDQLKAMPGYGGRYHSLTENHPDMVSHEEYEKLVSEHIMFKDMAHDSYLAAAGIASDWPSGRGCYVSEDRGFVIWVGEEDHLRIMCMERGTILNTVFDRLHLALEIVGSIPGLEFATSPDVGCVTSCPTNLGTGMRASVHLPIPRLTRGDSDAKAKAVCRPLGLSVRGMGGEHTPTGEDGTCDISPSRRFCITEAEIITALYTGIRLLMEEESNA